VAWIPAQAILFVIDGGKALRGAIKDVFGEHALVHRCHRHKERNVSDLLPERSAGRTATCPSAGPPPACTKPSSSPDGSSATRISPHSSSPSSVTPSHPNHDRVDVAEPVTV